MHKYRIYHNFGIMANTYTQIYIHLVFAVKNSNSLIPAYHLPRVFSYIGGTLAKLGHKPIEIGGIDSHVHILIGLDVKQSVADMVRDLKSATSRFINDSHIIPYRFEWQAGYGCFSYSQSHIENVRAYIRNQHQHHKSTTLEAEMRDMLSKFNIVFDEKYILKDPE